MTSSHGGGASNQVPDDHDPVRLTPPADPWLTEAPTTSIGDAAAGRVPQAGTAPFDGGPSSYDPPPVRERRAGRWIVAVLAGCALFIGGMLAVDQFRSGSGGDGADPRTDAGQEPTSAPASTSAPAVPAGGPASPGPATSGPSSSSAGAPVVVYQITASGSGNSGSVIYTDQDGDIVRLNGIALPWRHTFPVGAQGKPLVLDAQRKGGADTGPVTCTITLAGKVLSFTSATGRYASAQCSAHS